MPLINNRMLRVKNMFLRKSTENFTNVLIDTFKCVILASGSSGKLTIDVDRLQLKKILSEGNSIFEYRYTEEDKEVCLLLKIGGSPDEVKTTKDQLRSVGVKFSLNAEKSQGDHFSSDYEFNLSPGSQSGTDKTEKNPYVRFNTCFSEDQELISNQKLSDEFKDSSESTSRKKSSFGSLFNIFRKKKSSYSRSSGLLMLSSYNQPKGVLQSTLPVILNCNEGIIDRVSKYYIISPPPFQKYNLKVSHNIRESLELHIHFSNPPVHLRFYGQRSSNVFYSESKGYQSLRETEFLQKLSSLRKSLSSAYTMNDSFHMAKVGIDKCVTQLLDINSRIAHKLAANEYSTKTTGFAFRKFLDRKPNSRYTELTCFEFRPKMRKLVNFYLELNFDFNTHIDFLATFLNCYVDAFQKLETLIVSYFSYKNKQIRVNTFYVFLLRVFAFEVDELITDFKRVMLELLSASNYCTADKAADLAEKQKLFYDWFARYNGVKREFCTDVPFDMRDDRLRELIVEVAADKCKNLNFLKAELAHELKQLRQLEN